MWSDREHERNPQGLPQSQIIVVDVHTAGGVIPGGAEAVSRAFVITDYRRVSGCGV